MTMQSKLSEIRSISEMAAYLEQAVVKFIPLKGAKVSISSTKGQIRLERLNERIVRFCQKVLCYDEERIDLSKIAQKLRVMNFKYERDRDLYLKEKGLGIRTIASLSTSKPSFQTSEIFDCYYTAEELAGCKNSSTLTGDPTHYHPRQDLFITKDQYCLHLHEIFREVRAKNALINPYTSMHFSESDFDRLLAIPRVREQMLHLNYEQSANAAKVSDATVKKLIELAAKLRADTSRKDVLKPHLQHFRDYTESLPRQEKTALFDLYVDVNRAETLQSVVMQMENSYRPSCTKKVQSLVSILRPNWPSE